MVSRSRVMCLGMLGACLLVAFGCGDASTNIDNAQEASLFKKLVLNYIDIVHKNRGRLPKSQEALSDEFQKIFDDYLTENGIELHELLTSPRDGKPYVFVTEANRGKGRNRIVGYEQLGVNGVRHVGLMSGDVLEVDETGFLDLVPSK